MIIGRKEHFDAPVEEQVIPLASTRQAEGIAARIYQLKKEADRDLVFAAVEFGSATLIVIFEGAGNSESVLSWFTKTVAAAAIGLGVYGLGKMSHARGEVNALTTALTNYRLLEAERQKTIKIPTSI